MRRPRPSDRSRRFRPSLDSLERREAPATAVSSLVASPSLLSPPQNQFVKVTVSGTVIDTNAKVTPSVQFQVSDEYRRFEPGGKVVIHRISPTSFNFQFHVVLQARRSFHDTAGRQYFVLVGSSDYQNSAGLTVPVLVPYNKVSAQKMLTASSTAKRHVGAAHK